MDLRNFGTEISGNRRINAEFSSEARAAIVGARLAGKSREEVADAFHTKRPETISNIYSKAQRRKTTKSAARKGAPRKLSQRAEHRLIILARRSPRATYTQLKSELRTNVSTDTIKRALRRHGLKKWRAEKRIELTEDDAKERLAFCRQYNTPAKLRRLLATLFSDEATVQNDPDNPGDWVIRYSKERYRQDLVNQRNHGKPQISIMVWGMIWQRGGEGGKSSLVFCRGDPDAPRGGVSAQSYKSVLEEGLLPFYEPGDPFMQDNARIHKTGGVPEWLEEHGIWTIDWPAHSPDLNPIEHVWKLLKDKIREIEPGFQDPKKNLADIAYAEELLQLAWAEVDEQAIANLINSLEHRIYAVIRARGWYTHY